MICILNRLRGPWVTEDPSPEPTGLDRIGGTYPAPLSRHEVHSALRLATSWGETVLLHPTLLDRATEAVMALRQDGGPAGEVGDAAPLRRAVGGAR